MEENMFRETLLESAPSGRKRKRWPMAIAFTAQLAVAGLLVMLPLLSTGVISVSAHVPLVAPLGRFDIARPAPRPPAGGGPGVGHLLIVPLPSTFLHGDRVVQDRESSDERYEIPISNIGGPDGPPNLPLGGPVAPSPVPAPTKGPVIISHLSEALLINRVEPVYPKIAMLTGTQGAVKLHAIIARDGSIESLTVISGPPLLAGAAVDAVKRWRYRPYYLNGEPVEVETFITVNFKKTND
jgi:periplasmic protein TonB